MTGGDTHHYTIEEVTNYQLLPNLISLCITQPDTASQHNLTHSTCIRHLRRHSSDQRLPIAQPVSVTTSRHTPTRIYVRVQHAITWQAEHVDHHWPTISHSSTISIHHIYPSRQRACKQCNALASTFIHQHGHLPVHCTRTFPAPLDHQQAGNGSCDVWIPASSVLIHPTTV